MLDEFGLCSIRETPWENLREWPMLSRAISTSKQFLFGTRALQADARLVSSIGSLETESLTTGPFSRHLWAPRAQMYNSYCE